MEHEDPDLTAGGFAPTMLERFGPASEHSQWRDELRRHLQAPGSRAPCYLEAHIGAKWSPPPRAAHVRDLAPMQGKGGRPFLDVLLDDVAAAGPGDATTPQGTRFEAAAGLALSATPGFTVYPSRTTPDEQVDFVVRYHHDALTHLDLEPGPGLVECKSSVASVDSADLRNFGAKCAFHRVRFGVLVVQTAVAGAKFEDPQHAELVRRRYQLDGLTLLVLTESELRHGCAELRGIQPQLAEDLDLLVFGPRE